jgi:stage III sporulation protein AH
MKILKRNQIIISVIALMLITAGYLNFANQKKESDLIPTSGVADSELMAGIGDAKLVSANEAIDKNLATNTETQANIENNTSITNNNETSEDKYFNETRLEREKMYSQMLENYQKIIETDSLSGEEKKNAQDEIKKISDEKNAIMIAENLIKTKGFADVIIFKNNGNVTAIIKSDQLEEQEVSQVQNIITRELNVKVNQVNINSKK